MKLTDLKKYKIADEPGVYFFLRGKDILYIGKATSLRSRVRSYFSDDLIKTRGISIVDMVAKADQLKFEETPTVLEALIREANLIKKHQPYYNIKEKDNKSWNYVVITKEELPKVIIVRGRSLAAEQNSPAFALGDKRTGDRHGVRNFASRPDSVFGPFPSGVQLKEALKMIRRIFPFLDDKSKNYFEFYKQINLAPDLENKTLYEQNIKNIKLLFQGKKKKKISQELKKEMKAFAEKREFERAAEAKRQLFALEHINDVALLKEENLNPRAFRIEAYDIAHISGKSMVGVMTVVEGRDPQKNEYRKFRVRTEEHANDTGALKEILIRRLNHPEWPYPDLLVVDGSTAQINAAKAVFENVGLEIPIISVVKDEHHRPRELGGDQELATRYEAEILLANSEAHRFAITYHKNLRGRNFLNAKKK